MPRNPLRTYQFRIAVLPIGMTISSSIAYAAGVRTVSGLRAQISASETWEGGNNLHRYANPNKVTWEPITLEQGLALDETFETWAIAVLDFCKVGMATQGPVKRQVIIDVWDENGFPAGPPTQAGPPALDPMPAGISPLPRTDGVRSRRYLIHNAWISKYQAIPKLDSMTSEVGLLSVELMHEGWVVQAAPA